MNDTSVIQLKNISKTYHSEKISFTALKNIDLEINQGEYIAILGPSGSGKSTLMQIIGFLSTPTAGTYSLAGKEVSRLKRNELAKIRNERIGFVFQNFNLLPQINIIDNTALPLVYKGTGMRDRRQQAKDLLNKLGLSQHLEHKPNELSGGQQQRVAVARALITQPSFILADEPTGNLDTQSGDEVIALFEELSRQGKTIIIVTHNLALANRTQRIIHLLDGKLHRDERINSQGR